MSYCNSLALTMTVLINHCVANNELYSFIYQNKTFLIVVVKRRTSDLNVTGLHPPHTKDIYVMCC